MSDWERVVGDLERLTTLDDLTVNSVAGALGVVLTPIARNNPNLECFQAERPRAPWSRVELRLPARPGGRLGPGVLLDAREGCAVTRSDLRRRFGSGQFRENNVHRLPHGVISFAHELGRYRLLLEYSNRGEVLVGVMLAPTDSASR